MGFGLQQIVPPTAEPVSLAEAYEHCRADPGTEDGLLSRMIRSARRYVETVLRRQLVTATWQLTLDTFYGQDAVLGIAGQGWQSGPGRVSGAAWQGPGSWSSPDDWDLWPWWGGGVIRLPRPPLQLVSSIQYVDGGGVLQTMPVLDYQVDTSPTPGRVGPAYGKVWPVTRLQLAAITITYLAGYGTADAVPDDIKQAILLLVSHWERNRDAVGQVGTAVELATLALLGANYSGEYG